MSTPVFDVREVLALIPFLLGFLPERSLVMATVRTTGGRSWVDEVTRVDLPGAVPAGPERRDAHQVLVVYADDEQSALRHARAAAEKRPDATVVAVEAGAWVQLDSDRHGSVADLDDTAAAARMLLIGESYDGRRAPSALTRASAEALWDAAQSAARSEPRGVEHVLQSGLRGAARPELTPSDLGALAVDLADARTAADLLRYVTGVSPVASLVDVGRRLLDIEAGPEPSIDIARLEDLAFRVAKVAPEQLVWRVLGLAAVLGWWTARHPNRAGRAAHSADQADPGTGIVDLAADLFATSEVPGWLVRHNAQP